MDLYRNGNQTYNRLLLDLFRHKFVKHEIDLVVAYAATSLNFTLAHGNELFKQAAVVFSGIPQSQIKGLQYTKTTGVSVDIDYTDMLETALNFS